MAALQHSDIFGNWDVDDDDDKGKRRRGTPRQVVREAFAPAPHAGMQAAASLIGQGFANHANAANQINSAIGNEMESRVAQLREARRMEHEKEKLRMQMESRNQDREGELIRAILGKTYS
jgi:hypothetical protein